MSIFKTNSKFTTVLLIGPFLLIPLLYILRPIVTKIFGAESSLGITLGIALLVYIVFSVMFLLKKDKS